MADPPSKDQIHDALKRAMDAVKPQVTYPERILRQPNHHPEPRGEHWWHGGWLRVLGEDQAWDVLYDPVTDTGRARRIRPQR